MLIDDEQTVVGTANLDNHSFSLDIENSAIFAERQLATSVSQTLNDKISRRREASEFEYSNPSWVFRIAVRLLSSVL